MSNTIIEKKRKCNDTNDSATVIVKKQQKQQSITQYCFQKDDTCPICTVTLNDLTEIQIQSHVNSCLDNSTTTNTIDDSSSVTKIEDTIKEEITPPPPTTKTVTTNNDNSKSSWAKLFSEATFKIRGIWSLGKKDIAPGLTESEVSWFGEPKSSDPTIKKERTLPYYKRLAGTSMVVDAFSFGKVAHCEGYLLSHFHSDHYMGLNGSWMNGPIYCSEITARLVNKKLGVPLDFIHPLPMNKPCLLSGKDKLKVTLIDANHCPGAVLFLVQHGNLRYLHTGDFRANASMCRELKEPIDILYLDTTYLNPKYSFPPQEKCIQIACELAMYHDTMITKGKVTPGNNEDLLDNTLNHWFTQAKIIHKANNDDSSQRLVVVVGTYSLGKERIFIEIAKCLKSKVYVTDQKKAMLDCFGDEELQGLLTDNPYEAQVHVIPLWHVLPENLEAYCKSLQPHFTQMIAFRPTGWTFRSSSVPLLLQENRSLDSIIRAGPADLNVTALKPSYESLSIKIYGVPYSEHSSYRELALFISSLDVRRIVPTVNVYSKKSRINMSSIFDKWNKDKMKLLSCKDEGLINVIQGHW